jgi:hypothetical protein
MSFEGYIQRLCKNGHLEEIDVYDFESKNEMCDECGEDWIWQNTVDETNGGDVGRVELEIDQPYKYETTCECCGSQRLVAEETYKIPTE